ncbi:hypothetical protein H4687_000308 [Streptomyces stelliscabiei]|uniref:RCK N-terminal domain-containing protein n=1 Tax=Streptomyces stelliscabiei TaxID=146820 RepID=A0A8I0P0U2_9ACTN|nr:hypothetical protein [Streptomyces stelliscabiei]
MLVDRSVRAGRGQGARGIPLARRLRIPTVIGDVTEEGVLESAEIHRAHALLALTSSDTINLEATLYARSVKQVRLRVALRLYDDFATAVYRTVRATHPHALTRSRSVSSLAAPAFAGAMMGRQILGAIPVERKVLLFAALVVAGHPQLEGRTVPKPSATGPGASWPWVPPLLPTGAPTLPRHIRPTVTTGLPGWSGNHNPDMSCGPRTGSCRPPPGRVSPNSSATIRPGRSRRTVETGGPCHTADLLHALSGWPDQVRAARKLCRDRHQGSVKIAGTMQCFGIASM